MGVVFLAEQREPIRREVALKLIKVGMDTREVIRRFEGERQALAVMNHPGIAKVLDAGETESGRPYFVMERVSGEPVTDYCDRKRVGTRDRLALFVEVCEAVQHAHQKGVIHRDLKPGNVLVGEDETGKSRVKVIDFGIAKAMGDGWSESALVTVEGQVLGTPQYMSPEQAGAGPVDTRTDIYALGVILYELLTGGPPLRRETLEGAVIDEVLRRVREEEAERPSLRSIKLDEATATKLAQHRSEGVERWRRSLRGDLDWIVLKSLEKEAARRYGSAGEFAEDVERFLADEPVEARPPSQSYRVRKFVRRNRGLVATAGVVFVALFVATGVSVRWALEAQEARRLAEDRLAQADAVPEFLIEAFRSVDPTEGASELLAVDVLDQAVEEAIEEFSTQPVMRARILGALATTYQGLGYYVKAGETLQRAAEFAGDPAELPPDLRSQLLVVRSETYRLDERMLDAIEVSRRNLELVMEAHGEQSPLALEARSEHLRNLINGGELKRAEVLMAELRADYERLGSDAIEDYEALLASLRSAQGRFDEAIPLLEARLRNHSGSLVEADWDLMWKIRHLTTALLAAGRIEEAVAWSEVLLVCTESIYGFGHHHTAESAAIVARAYREIGEPGAAWLLTGLALEECFAEGLEPSRIDLLREHRESIELPPGDRRELERILARLGEDPEWNPDPESSLAECGEFWTIVAEYRARAGAFEAAAEASARSLEAIRNPADPRFLARTARHVLLLAEAEKRDEAVAVLLSLPDLAGEDPLRARLVLDACAEIVAGFEKAGEPERGVELDRRILLPAFARAGRLERYRIMPAYYRVVKHLVRKGTVDELAVFRREIVESLRPRGREADDILATVWSDVAAWFSHRKRPDEAHRELDSYAAWREEHAESGDRHGAFQLWRVRGFAFRVEGKYTKAEAALWRAHEQAEAWKGEDPENPAMVRDLERYLALEFSNVFRGAGDPEAETEWKIRAALLGVTEETSNQIEALIEQDSWDRAADFVAAVLRSEEHSQADRLSLAQLGEILAERLAAAGDREKAEAILRTTLRFLTSVSPPLPAGRLMPCYQVLQRIRSGPKDPDGNAAFHEEMVRLFSAGPGRDHPATRTLRLRHAWLLVEAGRFDEAFPRIEELASDETVREQPRSAWAIEVRATRGHLLGELGRHAEAEELLLAVWADCEAARDVPGVGPGPKLEARVARTLADYYERTGDAEAIAHWRAEAVRLENSGKE